MLLQRRPHAGGCGRVGAWAPGARKALCAAVVLAAAAIPPAAPPALAGQAAPDSLGREVDRLFARWDRPGSPGAAVGVFRDGEILYARGYGSAHLEWEAPISPTTVFHVASVSKQFTAYAVALLAERGDLSLDDDVRRHLPELPDFGSPISLRHLLHHTSGLRDQWTLLVMAGRRLDDVIGQEDVLALVRRQRELNFPPGEQFLYSNTGYTLLAEVVGRATGRPFAEWMRESVFQPLGMSRTWFQDDHERLVPGRAESYDADGKGGFRRRVLSLATVGATGLQTTVEDLARWTAHLDDPGPAEGGLPGARWALRRMEETGALRSGEAFTYALGQAAGRHRGLRTLEHGGGDAGFRSHLLRFPDRRLAVAVLANVAEIDPERLARRVADLYLAAAPEPVAAEGREGEPAGREGERAAGERAATAPEEERAAGEGREAPGPAGAPRLRPEELERVVGRYWSPATDEVHRVRVEEGRLLYQPVPWTEAELLPLGGGRFRVVGWPRSVEVRFQPSGSKAEHMLLLAGGGVPAVFRAVEPWTPSSAELREYEGEYWSEELGIAYGLRVEAGGLAVRHPRHGEILLLPAVPDAFTSPEAWLGRVRFLRDGEGRPAGFRASSARVRGLLFLRLE